MKKQTPLFVALFLLNPFLMTAQSIVGDWLMDGKTPDGQTVVNRVSFKADGALKVDFGNDGSIDAHLTYTVNGNKISMKDISDEGPCQGVVGVYEVDFQEDRCIAKVVDDACDIRRGDGKPAVMNRVN